MRDAKIFQVYIQASVSMILYMCSASTHSAGASVQVGVTELTILIHSTVHTVRTDRLTQRHSQTNPPNYCRDFAYILT